MKKYNKPEIEALYLDVVDVIQSSATDITLDALGVDDPSKANSVAQHIDEMQETWSW